MMEHFFADQVCSKTFKSVVFKMYVLHTVENITQAFFKSIYNIAHVKYYV